jgi:membrane protease YdiL (CAAX protease family)
MKIRWPPRPLGLGTPLNLAALSPETRPLLRRGWWLAPVLGLAAALLLVAIDLALFRGLTVQRLPELGSPPSVGLRVLIAIVGSVGEELYFRVFVATLAAWLGHAALSLFMRDPKAYAQWLGILVAAVIIGVWHVGDPADAPRVMTANVVTNVVYGWLYWWRGLEMAILAHMVVTAFLLIAVPAIF